MRSCGGTSWVNTGLTGTGVLALTVSGPNLFTGVQNTGVWWRPLAEMIPPALPVLVIPGHDAANQLSNLTLKINPSMGATGHHWQVSNNPGFSSTVVDDSTSGAGDAAHVVTLTGGMKYYWRVCSYNAAGAGACTLPDSFTTVISIPVAPTLASPANGSSSVPGGVTLKWNR